jgi:hypothetical protein
MFRNMTVVRLPRAEQGFRPVTSDPSHPTLTRLKSTC